MRVAILLLACAFTAQAKFMEVRYDQVSSLPSSFEDSRLGISPRDDLPEDCSIESSVLWQGSEDSPCYEDISDSIPWERESGRLGQ